MKITGGSLWLVGYSPSFTFTERLHFKWVMGGMIEEDSPETFPIPVGICIYGTIYVPHTKHLTANLQLKRFLKIFYY